MFQHLSTVEEVRNAKGVWHHWIHTVCNLECFVLCDGQALWDMKFHEIEVTFFVCIQVSMKPGVKITHITQYTYLENTCMHQKGI